MAGCAQGNGGWDPKDGSTHPARAALDKDVR